jgi:hypothetical protein
MDLCKLEKSRNDALELVQISQAKNIANLDEKIRSKSSPLRKLSRYAGLFLYRILL